MAREIVVHDGVIRPALVAELEAFRPSQGRVSSYYLDLNAPRQGGEAIRIAIKDTLAEQLQRIDQLDVPHGVRQSLRRDWELVKEVAPTVIGNRATLGLACFVASEAKYGKALRMPLPIRNRAFFEERFVPWPLRQILEQADRFAVVLTDKDEARLFRFFFEQIAEATDVVDPVPGRIRYPDQLRQVHLVHKHVEYFHHHFERVAEAALRLYEQEPFEHLIIGGRWETLPQFEGHLHRYVRDRIVARWEIDVRMPTPEVRERTAQEEKNVLKRQAESIWKVIQDFRPQRGALGAEEAFSALWQRRVQGLLEEPGVRGPGFRCSACGRLQLSLGPCVECGGKKIELPDIYEEAVHDAIEQAAQVRYFAHPELHQADSIAALRRY